MLWIPLEHDNVLPLLGICHIPDDPSKLPCLISPWMHQGTAREYLNSNSNTDLKEFVSMHVRGFAAIIHFFFCLDYRYRGRNRVFA
jgi:hypothetical protein